VRDKDLQLNIFTGQIDVISPTEKRVKYCNTCKKDLPVENFIFGGQLLMVKKKEVDHVKNV